MLQGWCAVQHAARTSEELPHWVTAGDDGNSCVTTRASISDVGGQRDAVLPVETCAPCGPICAPPDREGGASAAGGGRRPGQRPLPWRTGGAMSHNNVRRCKVTCGRHLSHFHLHIHALQARRAFPGTQVTIPCTGFAGAVCAVASPRQVHSVCARVRCAATARIRNDN